MFTHRLDDDRELRLVATADAQEMYELIDAEREMLAEWMPWAPSSTLATTRDFLARALRQQADDLGFHTVIVVRGEIVGTIGFNDLSRENRSVEIGYWLARRAQGRGTMTLAARALVEHAFGPLTLNRVVIRAGVANHRSRAVAERLGFALEGVARQAERRPDGRYIDLAVYAMLAADWPAAS